MRHRHEAMSSPDRPREPHPSGRLRLGRIALAAGLCLAGVGLPGLVLTASATEAGEHETMISAPPVPGADDAVDVLDAELIEPLVVVRTAG